MVTPLVAVDATYLGKQLDAPYYHRSAYFENKYKEATGQSITSFNFAIPGAMPSDAYLITKFLLKGEKKPDLLVYGVGPRDFLDNMLPSANATDPYKHLSRLGDVSDHVRLVLGDWQDKLNYALGRMVYTYGEKSDLACNFERRAQAALVAYLPEETPQQEWEYKQMVIPNHYQFEVLPNTCTVKPIKPGHQMRFSDNLSEYAERYRELKWETFLTQLDFLGETLDLANERKIHAVIMAMPITEGNRSIISDFVWHLYKQNLRVLAHEKGATYIDMQACAEFPQSDFSDTVHLNEKGGQKLLDQLAGKLAESAPATAALAPKRFDDESISLPAASMVAGLKGTGL
jgi:hypothetical protein